MRITGFNHLSIGTRNLAEFIEQNEEGLAASLYLDRPHLKTARRAG